MEADCDEVWKRLEAELDQHDTSLWSLEGDGWSALPVDQREFQVLTAASTLGERASLASITELVDNWTQREMVGHVYVTLGRLAERGLMKVQSDPPRPYEEPQYRIKLTEDGERALRRAKLEGPGRMINWTVCALNDPVCSTTNLKSGRRTSASS